MKKIILSTLILLVFGLNACSQEEASLTVIDPNIEITEYAKILGIKKATFSELIRTQGNKNVKKEVFEFDEEGNYIKHTTYGTDSEKIIETNGVMISPFPNKIAFNSLGYWRTGSLNNYSVITYNSNEFPINKIRINEETGDTIWTEQLTYYDNNNLKAVLIFSPRIKGLYPTASSYKSKGKIISKIDFNNKGFIKNVCLLDNQDTLYRIFYNYYSDDKRVQSYFKKSFIKVDDFFDSKNLRTSPTKSEQFFFNKKESIVYFDTLGNTTYLKIIPSENEWETKTFYDTQGRPSYVMSNSSNPIMDKRYIWKDDYLYRIEYFTDVRKDSRFKLVNEKEYIYQIREFDKKGNLIKIYFDYKTDDEDYQNVDYNDPYRYIKTSNGLCLDKYFEYDDNNNLITEINIDNFFELGNRTFKRNYEILNDSLFSTNYELNKEFKGQVFPNDLIENQDKYFNKTLRYSSDWKDYKERNPLYIQIPEPYVRVIKREERPIYYIEGENNEIKHHRNSKGQLIKITVEGKTTQTFKYDSRGAIIEFKRYSWENGDVEEHNQWEYEYY